MERLRESAMTDQFDGDDYNLRALIERMERIGGSDHEIEVAVPEASGCPSYPAGPRRRLQGRRRLWKREEGQR